jgi:YhcH/YjgK/YiaL family protein
MIFGHIEHSDCSYFHPLIQQALRYLRTTDLAAMATGQYLLDDFIVQVIDLTTQPAEAIKPEVHRKKIDIQFLHSGIEKIGCSIDGGNNMPASDYIVERDIQFYAESPNEFFINMIPGSFAIFYPDDIHRPACINENPSDIRKIVIKIELNKLI